MSETKPVQSLLRGIDLLQILCDAPDGMRLQDLAERIGLKVPTTHNLLRTLALRDLVEKRPGSVYVSGPAMSKMADRMSSSRSLTLAEETVLQLGMLPCRPVVNYCEIRASAIQVRLRVSPEAPGMVEKPAGRNNGLYSTATGLVALAFAPEDLALGLMENYPFEEDGQRLWQTREQLREVVQEVRQRGVAEFPWQGGELYKIAAPVRTKADVMVLGIAVPVTRSGDDRFKQEMIRTLKEAAEALGRKIRENNDVR